MARHRVAPAGQGDNGSADETLARVLAAGTAGGRIDPDELAAALRGARVFVGVEAQRTSSDAVTGADRTSEMALVTLRAESGATALPVFSSVAALAAWRPAARPVPVAAPQACAEAARQGLGTVVIDVAGPHTASFDLHSAGPTGAAAPVDDGGQAGIVGLLEGSGVGAGAGVDEGVVPDPCAAAGHRHESGTACAPRRGLASPPQIGTGGAGLTRLRPVETAGGPLDQARVRAMLRDIPERVWAWPAESVTSTADAPQPVLVIVPRGRDAEPAAAEAAARRLAGILATRGTGDEGTASETIAVIVVEPGQVPAVRRQLGRAMRSGRRWG